MADLYLSLSFAWKLVRMIRKLVRINRKEGTG